MGTVCRGSDRLGFFTCQQSGFPVLRLDAVRFHNIDLLGHGMEFYFSHEFLLLELALDKGGMLVEACANICMGWQGRGCLFWHGRMCLRTSQAHPSYFIRTRFAVRVVSYIGMGLQHAGHEVVSIIEHLF